MILPAMLVALLLCPFSLAQTSKVKVEYFGQSCRTANGSMHWITVQPGTKGNVHSIHHGHKTVGLLNYHIGTLLVLGYKIPAFAPGRPFLPGCSLFTQPLYVTLNSHTIEIGMQRVSHGQFYVAQFIVVQHVASNPRTILALSTTDAAKVTFHK